ncbi:MAG: hypothetical protein ACRDNZ_20965, partial [Streptosporangiaceae bacterium]
MSPEPMFEIAPVGQPAGQPGGSDAGPVRSGAIPPLAAGFVTRPETAPSLGVALAPGATVVLASARQASARLAAGPQRDWLEACGKTQLAVHAAESLWGSGEVDLLVWVTATSRASVMSAYVQAAAAAIGIDPAGDGESIAARFVSWLSEVSRPWLLVLDDLSDVADMEGLWPAGPRGRLLITTRDPGILPVEARAHVLRIGAFSQREAVGYVMGRLTLDLGQRLGAADLVNDLACEPLALAQASSVIAASTLSCRDYRGYFTRRNDQMSEVEGGPVPPAAVTWTFAFEQAGRLAQDGVPQSLLAMSALVDGRGIPGAVLTAPAVLKYLAAGSGRDAVSPGHARDALLVPARAGLA